MNSGTKITALPPGLTSRPSQLRARGTSTTSIPTTDSTQTSDYREERRREHHEADVVIVGAGIVGCAAAVAFGNQGRSVILLEKSLKEPDRIVGELLQPGGVNALEKLGMRGMSTVTITLTLLQNTDMASQTVSTISMRFPATATKSHTTKNPYTSHIPTTSSHLHPRNRPRDAPSTTADSSRNCALKLGPHQMSPSSRQPLPTS